MIYTHVLNHGPGVRSPLDALRVATIADGATLPGGRDPLG
jgi:hypothetical protein